MSGLSTHVLDTSSGKPAVGICVRLFRGDQQIGFAITNSEGRCPTLLPSMPLTAGTYRLVFETGAYFEDGFYPEVSVSFVVRDLSTHYHVPLLISPFGFTTYRGS